MRRPIHQNSRLARRSWRALVASAAMMLLASLALPACGSGDTSDDFSTMPGQNRPRRAAATPAAATPTPAGEPGAPSGTSPGVTRRTFAEQSRDPFVRLYPDQNELDPFDPGDATTQAPPVNPEDLGPLAVYAIEDLLLQGIMTRSARPVAMFQTPDGSLSTFAYIGDVIGPNAAGYIEDIQPNQIVVVYEAEPGGAQRRTIVPLRDPRQDIEADFERY